MWRLFWWRVSVLLLLAAGTAGAQVPNSSQNGQPPGSPPGASGATSTNPNETPTAPPTTKEQVTVTAPYPGQPLPALRPDQFINCMQQSPQGSDPKIIDYTQAAICEQQLNYEKRIVVEACINRDGKAALPRVIQACTESLDHKIFEGNERFFLFADRAGAYFAEGDKQHALDDYNEAIKLAPRSAELYYNRGVFYAAQSDPDAALRDFDAAISIDPKFVPALHQRAKIYHARRDFSSALADYSEAISLQPKTAGLWSERGYVCLRQHDFEDVVKDETRAIQLDPKLARAYFLRAIAFGGLGDRANSVSDIQTAVDLDPSLAHYVTIKGKTASLALPPL
jgi:tetratricopeptide (TPR) repeat protein